MIDPRKLEQIEAQLTEDELYDDELATALHEAGLPEVARVVRHLSLHAHGRVATLEQPS
jgi:hypothetical protein